MPDPSSKVYLAPTVNGSLRIAIAVFGGVVFLSSLVYFSITVRNRDSIAANVAPLQSQSRPADSKTIPLTVPPASIPDVPKVLPAPIDTDDNALHQPMNLLALIDPDRDAVVGVWKRNGAGLINNAASYARLQIPYDPPAEYDLTVEFTRLNGDNEVSIIAKHGSKHQFRWVLGGWHNEYYGFDLIGGKVVKDNPTGRQIDAVLKNNVRYTTTVEVRHKSIAGYLQGQLLSRYTSDFNDITLWTDFGLPDTRTLGIASQESDLLIHSITLKPVSGKGRIIDDAHLEPGRIRPERSAGTF